MPYMPINWGGFGGQWGGSPMAVPLVVSGLDGVGTEAARHRSEGLTGRNHG